MFPRGTVKHQLRKVYNPLGFAKGYNFTLWFIFGGALFGFCLARFKFLNVANEYCPHDLTTNTGTPEQCYWLQYPRYRVGMLLHLATVLPAGLLAVFQFVPAIRHNFVLYHRMAGYFLIILITAGNIGAVMIAQRAMEGDMTTRTFVGFIALFVTVSFGMAIYNIKRLQIDQHRAWMLRTWFYIGFIVTLRIIQILMALVISAWPSQDYYLSIPCEELAFAYKNDTQLYQDQPACMPGNERFAQDGYVAVKSNLTGGPGQAIAAISSSFSAAGVLALVLHALGVEVYLRLTPRESERLRKVSYEKQLERGFLHPGCAGLTADRLGDSEPWVPKQNGSQSSRTGSSIKKVCESTEVVPVM